jgi:hypothetical protein
MASPIVQQHVYSMQHEANLLHDHARGLADFANELSSYASSLSYQSQTYYTQSDELNKLAGFIMAGASVLDPDSAEEDVIAAVRVTAEVARAAETTDVRTGVQNMVQGLISILSGQDLASSPLSQAAMKICQGALRTPSVKNSPSQPSVPWHSWDFQRRSSNEELICGLRTLRLLMLSSKSTARVSMLLMMF